MFITLTLAPDTLRRDQRPDRDSGERGRRGKSYRKISIRYALTDFRQITTYLLTEHQFKRWLATTDADLTFHGKPILDLDKRDGNTMVTYCNNRIDNICGGTCQVYNGGPTCIDAPGTKCIAATNDVGFCDRKGCGHSCHQISTCGTSLENNFCYTPGTQSILVGA